MPLPFSHIVYADKILQTKLKNRKINQQEYFIGSLFPDIRYLTKEPREKTHKKFKTTKKLINKIEKEKDSFKLGLLVHWLTDYQFAKYWLKYFNDVRKYIKNLSAINVLNDQILFDKFKKRNEIIKYFNVICARENKKIKLEYIKKQHEFIKIILTKKLNYSFGKKLIKILGINKDPDKIFEQWKKIKKDKKIIQKIKNFENVL